MAPASLNKLKMQAKKLGFSRTDLAGADRSEILEMIAQGGPETESENGKPRKKSASKGKAAVKKAVTRKKAASPARKSAPAKSRKSGTAKRQTARKAEASKNGYQAKGGRNVLEGVDYSEHEDWNPRPGSAPDRIIKALRKFHGKREKVFEFLLPDIGDFVKARKADGTPWDKGDGPGTRKGMLKYRIARTAWQFAIQTGQHEKAENRVTYGEGGTGAGIFKRTKAGRKAATAKPAKRGRPPKTHPTRKPAQAQVKRGRGRPRKTEAVAQPRKTRTVTRKRQARRKAAVRGK